MDKYFGPDSSLGQVFSCLLLAAFVFIGLIPTGFMPDIGQKSGAYITICSGLDTRTIKTDGDAPTHTSDTMVELCNFTNASPHNFDLALPSLYLPKPAIINNAPANYNPIHRQYTAHAHSPRGPPAV